MPTNKIIGAVAVAAALAGGGAVGAYVGVPMVSGAATTASTTTPAGTTATPNGPATDKPPMGRPGPRQGGVGLEAAAKALGMSVDDLRAALKTDKTIAAVAKKKGVAVQKVIDAMVAAEKAEIDKRAAAAKDGLEQRVTDQVNKGFPTFPGGGGGKGGPGMGRHGSGGHLDAAAKALGMSTDDLRTALKTDKTIAAVAKKKGVSAQKVIDAMVAESNAATDKGVEDGHIKAADAAKIKADAKTRITDFVNNGFKAGPGGMPGGMPGGPGGRGPGGMHGPDGDGPDN